MTSYRTCEGVASETAACLASTARRTTHPAPRSAGDTRRLRRSAGSRGRTLAECGDTSRLPQFVIGSTRWFSGHGRRSLKGFRGARVPAPAVAANTTQISLAEQLPGLHHPLGDDGDRLNPRRPLEHGGALGFGLSQRRQHSSLRRLRPKALPWLPLAKPFSALRNCCRERHAHALKLRVDLGDLLDQRHAPLHQTIDVVDNGGNAHELGDCLPLLALTRCTTATAIARYRHTHVFGVRLADAVRVLRGPVLEVVDEALDFVYGTIEASEVDVARMADTAPTEVGGMIVVLLQIGPPQTQRARLAAV